MIIDKFIHAVLTAEYSLKRKSICSVHNEKTKLLLKETKKLLLKP